MDHSEVKHLPKVDHAPAELEDWQKTLLKAASLVEDRGLCKNVLSDSAGAVCINGAILTAMFGSPIWEAANSLKEYLGCEAYRRMKSALGGEYCPSTWNNKPERTKEEVVAKLRSVALGHGD